MTTPLMEIVNDWRKEAERLFDSHGCCAGTYTVCADRIEAEARGVDLEYRSKAADSHVWSVWLPLGTRGDWRNFPANTVFEYRAAAPTLTVDEREAIENINKAALIFKGRQGFVVTPADWRIVEAALRRITQPGGGP